MFLQLCCAISAVPGAHGVLCLASVLCALLLYLTCKSSTRFFAYKLHVRFFALLYICFWSDLDCC
jgi:uncharacterized membrane protein